MIKDYYELWDPKADYIQIVLGKNVLSAYSHCFLFVFNMNDAQRLVRISENIRSILASNGFELQNICITASSDIPPNAYIIFFGAQFWLCSYPESKIGDVLVQLSNPYPMQRCTYSNTLKIFDSEVLALQANDFQKAIKCFEDSYYCASFKKQSLALGIQSLIALCIIKFINHEYFEVKQFSSRACLLAENPDIVDPFLKYQANTIAGTALSELGNGNDACAHFEKALHHISNLHIPQLNQQALSAMIQIRLSQRRYFDSAELINHLLESLKKNPDEDINTDTLYNIARFQALLYKISYQELKIEYDRLKAEYDRISHSFLYVFKELLADHQKVFQYLGHVAVTFVISKFGGSNNITINQYSRNGNNTISDSYIIRGE